MASTCRRCGLGFDRGGSPFKNCPTCVEETTRGACELCGVVIERPAGQTGRLPKRCPPCTRKVKNKRIESYKVKRRSADPGFVDREREQRRDRSARYRERNHDSLRKRDRERKVERWANDPEWREKQKMLRISSRYGLTAETYTRLRELQEDACAICGSPPRVERRLHIDHDHSCCPVRGRSCGTCVRGLLCDTCNVGLGMFRDDLELLQVAISYLQSPPARTL